MFMECIRVRGYVRVSSCVRVYVAVFRTLLVRSDPFKEDTDPIRIGARHGSDIQAIRRPILGMIQRSVSVRAVKTRWRFGSKTASFHVSVCYCVFKVIGMLYMLPLSFHMII